MEPLPVPPYLSPSSIGTFQTCPLQYKFSRIDKLVDPPTEATTLGNFVHEVLEELHKLPAELRTFPQAKVLLAEKYNSTWEAKAADIIRDREQLLIFRWKAFWCVENYFAIEDPTTVKAGGIEAQLLTNPNDEESFVRVGGVPIKGFIDRWDIHDDGVSIVDFKTGKTPKKQYEEPKFQQLAIYADAIATMTGETVTEMTLLYLKDGTVIKRPVTTERIEQMRHTVQTTYVAVKERCAAGFFEPTKNTLCGWCSYKRICPAWN